MNEKQTHTRFFSYPKPPEYFVNDYGLLANADETQAGSRNPTQRMLNTTYLKRKLPFRILR